jgi:hypothetical protein
MATDGPDPTPCNQDVFDRGTLMFQTHSIGGSNAIERWVQKIAKVSGELVDWHFAGGRVMVLALGNLDRVKAAIRSLMSEHDEMFLRDMDERDRAYYKPARPGWWNYPDAAEVDTVPRMVTMPDGSIALYDPLATAMVTAVDRYNRRQRRAYTRRCIHRAALGTATAEDKAWLRGVGAGSLWTNA